MVAEHKKVTMSLDARLLQQVHELVQEGEAKSQSAFVEDALRQKIAAAKRERRRRALIAASKDPMFLADIEEIEHDFAYADAEAARMIK